MNIAQSIERARRDHPDRPALLFEGAAISYADLDRSANRAANLLRSLGVGPGDRVALCLPNSPAFVFAYLGALKLGAIVASVNTSLTPDEARYVLDDSGATVLVTTSAMRDATPNVRHVLVAEGDSAAQSGEESFEAALAAQSDACEALDLDPAAPAALVYTSGTTGVPKGATLSHGNVTFVMEAKQRYLGIREDDRLLLFLPLYHCFGQNAILNAGLHAGATIVLQRGFDAARVTASLAEERVTMLFGVPATFIVLLEQATPRDMASVRYCFSAAAPLPVAIETRWRERFALPIHQGYGLTETSPFATYNHISEHRVGSIGTPIDGVELEIVDPDTGRRLKPGEIGEIAVRGPNVMLGYWNRPQETAEAIRDGWFHTGDLGRRDERGYFFIEDRLKDMVIVGGSNVYPAEVENVLLQYPSILEAAVFGVPDPLLGERVWASIVPAADQAVSTSDILAWCRSRLAPFKVPSHVEVADALPKNRTGKVLKRVLRELHAPQASESFETPDTPRVHDAPALERWIAEWLADRLTADGVEGLSAATIDRERPIVEYGATSITAVELAAALEQRLDRPVHSTIAWQCPTIRALAGRLAAPGSVTQPQNARDERGDEPVAIIGMACRYPGASGLEGFWQLLVEGRDAVSEVPKDRWDIEAFYDPDPSRAGKMTSRWAGIIERLDEFDAAFFGISPREAPHVDPRQRLALEIAWEALEDAGVPPDTLAGTRTGVFMATLTNDYDHLLFENLARADAYSGAGTANSVVANRLSYFFDLRGPSLALDTACSGSLVAIHLACESLRSGESTLALAGGVNVNLMPKSNVFFSKAGALSPTGRCRTFDRDADGMVRSDGAGIVVLKLLSKALEDGDPIVAVIKGSAVNHDGRSNGLMAPNGEAQKAVLAEACRRARVSPADVQLVEAHGTGTRLGDPIEVEALGAVLAQDRPGDRRCLLGSVKTNIGHTEAAAAVAGVIKTALAMQHRVVPPTIHFNEPNPLIPFDRLPFEVPRAVSSWPSPDRPLVGGVSGFGFGGTNAHLVLQEAPLPQDAAAIEPPYVLPISAKTPQALRMLATRYRDLLVSGAAAPGDICCKAARGRSHHVHRMAVVGGSREELRVQLERRLDGEHPSQAGGKLAFVFSGQGSHWPGMGQQLYAREPVFRDAFDACDCAFAQLTGRSLLAEVCRDAASSRIDDTEITQPAIFAVQTALHALWRSFGIVPDAVVGHSLGEVAAACAAGVLTIEDGMRVVVHRSRLMKRAAGRGRTAVVGLPLGDARAAVRAYEPAIAVAGSNSPTTSVIAGEPGAIDRLLAELGRRGVFCRAIPGVDIAFHSPQMDPLRAELVAALSDLRPAAASVPLMSTVTGTFAAGETFDADYWGRNLREPFLFARAIDELLAGDFDTFVEVSPHSVLGSSIVQCARAAGSRPAFVSASMRRGEDELRAMYAALAGLYERGSRVNWAGVYSGRGADVALPTYPWQRQRFWFDQLDARSAATAAVTNAPAEAKDSGAHPLLGDLIEPANSVPAAPRVCLWERDLDSSRQTWLADHRVQGRIILPGAATLEMALSAARQVWASDDVMVSDVAFEHPLDLTSPRRVQVMLTIREREAEFQLHSRPAPDERARPTASWTRHASGRVRVAEAAATDASRADLAETRARVNVEVPVVEHYEAMHADGLDYGPAFRGVSRLWSGKDEAVAEIRLAPELRDDRLALHPALLDAAFQVVAAAVRPNHSGSYLPRGVDQWRLFQPAGDRIWCHAALTGGGSDGLRADLVLFSADGAPVARVEGLALARVSTAPRPLLDDGLIEERWDRSALPSPGGATAARWLILCDDRGTGDALVKRLTALGHAAVAVYASRAYRSLGEARVEVCPDDPGHMRRLLSEFGPVDHAVHLWSLDSRARGEDETDLSIVLRNCGSAVHLAQALIAAAPGARLWLVTRRALPVQTQAVDVVQAPLHGLALAVAQEHPELRPTSVDVDVPALNALGDTLLAELLASTGESRVAWRGRARYAARIHRAAMPAARDDRTSLRPDASYLITGGLGALGLQTALALARAGARHLVLTGRTGSSGREDAVREIVGTGARVTVVEADVSKIEHVNRLFDETLSALPPLAGIVHAAGVLDDALVEQQSIERLEKVFGPKVQGTWNLHRRTRDLALDFFVLYSSAASLVGSPGQSNYAAANAFMDAVAHHRRANGLPATTINWGAWHGKGMAGSDAMRRRLESRGVAAIDPAAGLAILEQIIGASEPPTAIGMMPADWTTFVRQFGPQVPPRFAALVDRLDEAASDTATGSPQSAPRGAELRRFLRDQLSAVLGFGESVEIGPRDKYFDLGMDSLMTVEFRNRLQQGLGLTLPATLAFDYPTLETLAAWLEGELDARTPRETREAAPSAPIAVEPAQDVALDNLSAAEIAQLLARELDGEATRVH